MSTAPVYAPIFPQQRIFRYDFLTKTTPPLSISYAPSKTKNIEHIGKAATDDCLLSAKYRSASMQLLLLERLIDSARRESAPINCCYDYGASKVHIAKVCVSMCERRSTRGV